jgi:transcriptional regulator with XRE-family HTH domain
MPIGFSHAEDPKKDPKYPEIGRRLKDLRLTRGDLADDMANIADVDVRTWQYLESGMRACRDSTLRRISSGLNVDFDELRRMLHRPPLHQTLSEIELELLAKMLAPKSFGS